MNNHANYDSKNCGCFERLQKTDGWYDMIGLLTICRKLAAATKAGGFSPSLFFFDSQEMLDFVPEHGHLSKTDIEQLFGSVMPIAALRDFLRQLPLGEVRTYLQGFLKARLAQELRLTRPRGKPQHSDLSAKKRLWDLGGKDPTIDI